MPLLHIPSRFYRQPQETVVPDEKFVRLGLTSLIRFDGPKARDILTGSNLTVTGSPTADVGTPGRGLATSAITDNWSVTPDSRKILSTSGNTIVLVIEKNDATNRAHYAFTQTTSAVDSERFSAHIPWTDGTLYFDFGGATGANRLAIASLSFTGPQVYVFSGGPLGIYAYRNGILLGSQTTAITRTDAAVDFWLNRYDGDLVTLYGVAVFNKQLPLDIQRELSVNPSQLYKAPVRNVGFVAGGVTAALTGNSLSLAQGSLVASVSAPLTGNATSLAQGTVTPSVSVTAALTGNALSVAQGSVVASIAAPLSGNAVSVAQGTVVAAVTMPLTGNAVALAQGSLGVSVAPQLTGNALSLAQGDLAIGGDIVRALTGNSLSIAQGTVSIEASQQAGGHFIPQYVTRKIKKRDTLREELLEVLYPETKIEEILQKSLPEIKVVIKSSPKRVQLEVAPILAKLVRLEKELEAIEMEREEEDMLIFMLQVA